MNKASINEGYLRDPSTDLSREKSVSDHEPETPTTTKNNVRNTLRPTEAVPKYGQHKRSSNSLPRPCRPPIIPFDTEKYTDIFIKLESLKNFDTEELPRPGEFVIRVVCMGQVYGHFPSGNVNLHSLAYYAREEPNRRRSPDIFLDHDISFCIRFKDLVDNPLVLHLCHGGGLLDSETYGSLPALGFICLDLGRILNYKVGKVTEHIEPWIIPEKQANAQRLPFVAAGMSPLLQVTIECSGGLPDSNQLLQGNLMTVLCESLHNLPAIVQQNASYPDNQAEVQVFMTLPHSPNESTLRFPGGKYRETFLLEPTFRKVSQTDETTQTGASMAELNGPLQHTSLSMDANSSHSYKDQGPNEPRHWASVKENSPDIPLEATAMAGDTFFDPVEYGGDGETEIFGDGREDFMEFSETGEPRIVWNSIHRKYLAVDSYRAMLGRLSQNAIWPIEIAVSVKKKSSSGSERSKKKNNAGVGPASSKNVFQGGAVETQVSTTSSNESNDRMIMSELGQQSSVAAFDQTMIYHGIAFVDLSCLVCPGLKSARFSCRVYPFSIEMLQRRTCVAESVLPEVLLLSLVQKTSGENTKAGTKGTSHQDIPLKHRGSIARRSDFPDSMKTNKVMHEDPVPSEGTSGAVIERNPFIVLRISMLRSIVPCYKTTEISKVVDEYLPKRELTRRKLVNASSAQQKYRRAILEAAAEISHEFSEHYWKDVLQNGQGAADQSSSNAASNETLKKGFLFYLNASGRYLILREHLRSAICNVVQQKCLNLRPSGFHNHRDFQSYLHDMYVYLVDEMHDILNSTTLQETDPLKSNLDRLLQQTNCAPEEELSKLSLHNRQITDLGIFAEESFAQGDFETCHKLHLQRICRDKESSGCWTEFAIMWLARGDDRMAEIAVREALRKDPLHLYALLISGMISVRHGDERGLDCLGAALGLLPMAPEILVIVGISNSLIGNDITAHYFFRKAAYVHQTITGQTADRIEEVEKLFAVNNAKKPFNMKQFAQDMDAGVPHLTEHKKHVQVDSPPFEPSLAVTNNERKSKKMSKSKHRFSQSKEEKADVKKASIAGRSVVEADNLARTQSKQTRKSMDMNNNVSKANNEVGELPFQSIPLEASSVNQSSTNGPKFSFVESLSDILQEEVDLPPLAPSIQSPYDVTQFSEKLEQHLLTIDYLEKHSGIPKPHKSTHENADTISYKSKGASIAYNNVYIPKDEGIATDNQIKEEYDKIINNVDGVDSTKSHSVSHSGTLKAGMQPFDAMSGSSKTKRTSKPRLYDEKAKAEQKQPEMAATAVPQSIEPSIAAQTEIKISTDQVPKLTNRLGTELIWAANLLINLRLFDFADGVLAKHLYFYGKRSVQFIYLRALSLYLRQREEEALPLIQEAIEYDNANGMYYALEGHCYYVLGNTNEAINSYEKALRVPHINENRHLLYLRYGSLVLDQGKSKIAKRVFLHGVGKYPTPYMWLALGSACFQRQEYDQAESAFAEANRLDSTNPIAWGHLALSSLMQDKKALAEQSYKWAMRFGLKKGVLLDEIQRLQREKGIGDPSFPRVPNCVPHEYYLRRMGRIKPFNLYKESLNQEAPRMEKDRYEDTETEAMLKRKLNEMNDESEDNEYEEEWDGEGEYESVLETMSGYPNPSQSTGFNYVKSPETQVRSAPAEMMTIKPPTTTPVHTD